MGRVGVAITKGCNCNSNTFTTDVLSEIEEVIDVSSQQESIVVQSSSSSLAEVGYSKDTDDKVSLQ